MPDARTRTLHPPEPDPTCVIADGTAVRTPLPPYADSAPGYVVIHEIARGGMGRVVAARDPKLNREVAIKFLLPTSDPTAADRFAREAEITARLPHPGVPPVHALGHTPAGQPFLVMKLVRGRTLAALLGDRPDPRHALGRFVGVFEQLCQAVGYAHSQGIIHRDLKPANVMVGAFGEVQVMDWGLAADGAECGVRRAEPRPETRPACPGSAPTSTHSALTLAGTVLGTPGYMAPEQARGEAIDARADVFALGGVLALILTGRQPVPDDWTARSAAEDGIAAAAALRADLPHAGADPELARLAYACLSPHPGDRPADGKAVAEAVAAYRARAEERARRAESDRAAAEARVTAEARASAARAAAEGRTRRAHAGLWAAFAVMGAAAGLAGWWHDRVERERQQEAGHAAAAQARLQLERNLAQERADGESSSTRADAAQNLVLADDLRDRFRFDDADRAVKLAAALAARVESDDLVRRAAEAKAQLDTVRALDAARTKQLVWVPQQGSLGRYADASGDFRAAFAAAGLDFAAEEIDALVGKVTASPIKTQLVAALDDWAAAEDDRRLAARALEVARLADPGPWTDRLRDPEVRADPGRLADLAAEAEPAKLTSGELVSLARVMMAVRLDPAPVLLRAHAAHPADYRIAFHLGDLSVHRDAARAAGFYRTARAMRPDNFAANVNLGVALMKAGDPAGARDAYLLAARIDPDSPLAAYNLGRALAATGDRLGAAASLLKATRNFPGYVDAQLELARVLDEAGDLPAAVEAAWAATRADPADKRVWDRLAALAARTDRPHQHIDGLRALVGGSPDQAVIHTHLGGALVDAGRPDEGIAALRRAVELAPGHSQAYQFLGVAYSNKGDGPEAIRWHRKAVDIDPTSSWAQTRLGGALVNAGREDDGIAALDAAARLDPTNATAFEFLGIARNRKREFTAAAGAFRRAAELEPTIPQVHYQFGTALLNAGDAAGAVDPLREATRRDPGVPQPWTNLGSALLRVGRTADAAAAFREALRVRPGFPPAAAGLAEVERLLAE
ncbi:MAG: tetratricopeptide repeat protein [Gemmataceae bacterium]